MNSPLDLDKLVQQLAAEEEAGDSRTDASATVTSTAGALKAELDTLAEELRAPPPADEFADESACGRAIEAVQALGRDPSFSTRQRLEQAAETDSGAGHVSGPSAGGPAATTLGHYTLLERLGQGGMGAVYKALHTKLDKVVALKVLPADRMQDPAAVARFEREMRAVGKLHHPNIVAAHDAGEINGTHYLVMELVEGIDVGALVKRHGPLPVADACEIIRQAALGLQHAHEHGLVHRDIKPSNLMLAGGVRSQESGVRSQGERWETTRSKSLTPDSWLLTPQVKLLDLGLALLDDTQREAAGELTSTGQIMGTIDYMAPEQGSDTHHVDIRADIYSLGATLYKLLTGRAPFEGPHYNTTMKKLTALATIQPAPVRELRPVVPADLAAIVERMLAKDPAQRLSPPSVVAALLAPFAARARLGRLLEGETESASAARPDVVGTAHPTEGPEARGTEWPVPSAGEAGDGSTAPTLLAETDSAGVARPGVVPTTAGSDAVADADAAVGTAHPAEAESMASRILARRGAGRRPKRLGLLLGGLAAAIVLGVTVFKFATRDGTLVVTLRNVETAEVFVDGQKAQVKASDDGRTLLVSVDSGARTISVRTPDGTELATTVGGEKVRIAAGGKSEIEAWLEPAVAVASPHDVDIDRRVAEWVLSLPREHDQSDIQRLVGLVVDRGERRLVEAVEDLPQEPFRVVQVSISRCRMRDEDLARLQELQKLDRLDHLKLAHIPTEESHLAFLGGLAHLTHLSLHGCGPVSDAALAKIKGLEDLVELKLNLTSISDEGLRQLSAMPELRNLELGYTGLTGAGLAHLRGMPKLAQLQLGSTPITDAALQHLADITALTRLNLNDTRVSDAGLMQLHALKQLRWVGLRGTNVTPAGVEALRRALPDCRIDTGASDDADRRVTEWVLSRGGAVYLAQDAGTPVSSALDLPQGPFVVERIRMVFEEPVSIPTEDFAALADLTGMKKLELIHAQVPAGGLALLKQCDALTHVTVQHMAIDGEGLAHLAAIPNLENLNLDSGLIAAEHLSELAAAKRLKVLWAPRTTSDAALETVASLPALESLTFWMSPAVSNEGLRRIATLKKDLAVLNLNRTGVTDAGLKELRAFRRLSHLGLFGLQITDAGLENLASLGALRALNLRETKVTSGGVARLREALPRCRIESDFGTFGPVHSGIPRNFALQFDGVDDSVEIHSLTYDGSHPLTIEAWAQPSESPNSVRVLIRNNSLQLRLDTDLEQRSFWHATAPLIDATDAGGPPPGHVWSRYGDWFGRRVHVAAVCDGTSLRLFVDGRLESEVQGKGLPRDEGEYRHFLIGGGFQSPPEGRFAGTINDVRISDVARYSEGFIPAEHLEPDEHTLALYHFDEGQGDVLHDASGHGHEGKIVGATWVRQTGPETRAPARDYDADRRVAEWVLSIGGRVIVAVDGTDVEVANVNDLPKSSFATFGVLLHNASVRDADLQRLNGLPGITHLDVRNTAITDEGMAHVKRLAGLKSFDASGTGITDAGFSQLVGLPRLESLGCEGTRLTDDGLESLTAVKGLKTLGIAGSAITDNGLSHLRAWPGLESLAISLRSDAQLRHLEPLTALKHISIGGEAISDAAVETLRTKPLRSLEFVNTRTTDAGLARLASVSTLESLSLIRTDVTAGGVASLRRTLPNCRISWDGLDRNVASWVLSIGGTVAVIGADRAAKTITDAGELPDGEFWLWGIDVRGKPQVNDATLESWRGLRRLEQLVVQHTSITDDGLAHIRDFPQLTTLDIQWTNITDEGFRHLKETRKLTSITANGTQVGDEGLAQLSELEGIRQVSVCVTQVTDAGLAHLRPQTQLEALHLSSLRVTDAGIAHLSGMTRMRELGLERLPVTDAALQHLAGMTELRDLILHQTQVTDAGLVHLGGMKHLRWVDLRGTQVTAAGVGALRKGVPDIRVDWDGYDREVAAWVFTSGGMLAVRTRGESRTIDGIDALPAEGFEIEVVELGGAAGLRDADLTIVRGLKRLRVLDLSRTPVGDAGLEHIRGLHNLQTVYLKNTRVTDAGLPHLLALVDLTHVDLNGPQITDKGLETLKDLKHLTTLSLSECRVTDQGLAQLRGHPELRRLMLEGTQVTDAAIDVLLTLAKLEEVNLIDTRVTAEGVARLKEALPGRKVDWIPKWTPTPEQQAFIEAVMLLPAEEQVAAFTQKLKAVNPGYDVSFEHIVAEGKVVRVSLKGNTQTVRAIWPIAALTGLTELALGEAPVADLSPVTRLTELRFLSCYRTAVTDIEPVSALRNLEVLDCRETLVRDLSPLAGLPLKELRTFAVSPYNEQFRHLAGTCPQLETINGLPIAEFLARRDEVEQLRKLLPAYPAERQLELVVERLKAFNPGWNGELERNDNHPEIVDGKVVRFALAAPHRASDLSPLRALRHLKRLFCNGNQELADLSPLSGMELIDLYCQASGIADLAPLRGMPLAALVCEDNPVTDLSPLAGAPLSRLECSRTRVVDLTPLVNCPLEFLSFSGTRVAELSALERAPLKFLWCDATRVSDLSALRGAPLEELVCNGTTISDLSPLVGMPLKRLKIASTRVTDLSPLAELPLEELVCAGTQVADLSSLAGLKLHVLECQSTPVSDLSPLADLPLVDLNCSFTSVSDLTPLARLKLTRLWLMGTQVNDLTPLKGMPLNALDLASAPVTDLAPLAGLPLGYVNCSGTPVSDLAPLRKTPVTTLLLNGSRVADLSPLQGLPLTHLNCDETSVSDYSPLSGMPLTELGMTPRIFHQADEDLLRSFMSLTKVNYVPMDEFWQSVTRRRQETEEFVAAAKDLGPQEQALAVIEQLRKVHAGAPEGWLAASSRVIDGDSVELSIQVNQGNLIDLRPLRALSRLKVLRVSGYLPLLRDLSPLNSLPLEELEVTDPVLGPLSLQANLPVLRAMHSLKSINGRPAAEYLRLLAEPDRVVAESVLSRSGQVTITGNVIVTSTELPAAPFRVAEVNYSETTVTDDDLAELEYLPGLRTLRISGTNIGDRGFATICKLPSLQHFVAHSVPVTDEGLKQVADLKGLRILHLSSSRLTDRSLSVIAALRNLDYLYVGSVQFTDDGLRALTNLETLTSFGVWSEGFTDEGVGRVLDRLNPERLSELQLGAPGITDRTLQRLTRFTQVRGLDLRGTAVTDAGLLSLHGLHELSAIDLTSTRVTAAGVAELRQALPKCKVVWDGAEAQP